MDLFGIVLIHTFTGSQIQLLVRRNTAVRFW